MVLKESKPTGNFYENLSNSMNPPRPQSSQQPKSGYLNEEI